MRLTGRAVTLTLHGPIGELAAALGQERATSALAYTATVAPQAHGPAPGGITPASPTASWPNSASALPGSVGS